MSIFVPSNGEERKTNHCYNMDKSHSYKMEYVIPIQVMFKKR